jgi:hypothetical protein
MEPAIRNRSLTSFCFEYFELYTPPDMSSNSLESHGRPPLNVASKHHFIPWPPLELELTRNSLRPLGFALFHQAIGRWRPSVHHQAVGRKNRATGWVRLGWVSTWLERSTRGRSTEGWFDARPRYGRFGGGYHIRCKTPARYVRVVQNFFAVRRTMLGHSIAGYFS